MLKTNRLIIRHFVPQDGADLFEYLSDPNVVRFEPYGVLSMEECREEAERRTQDDAFFAVCLCENGKLIGNIYLQKQEYETWELGFVFNAAYQGKGYALESARALLDHVFEDHGAHRVAAFCNPDNERSWRLLERLHMRREGHFIKNIYFKKDEKGNPLWLDTYQYAILASEWKALRQD